MYLASWSAISSERDLGWVPAIAELRTWRGERVGELIGHVIGRGRGTARWQSHVHVGVAAARPHRYGAVVLHAERLQWRLVHVLVQIVAFEHYALLLRRDLEYSVQLEFQVVYAQRFLATNFIVCLFVCFIISIRLF